MKPEITKSLQALEKNGFHTHAFETIDQLREFILNEIPVSKSVGFGGSHSITDDIDLYNVMKDHGYTVYHHGFVPPEERGRMMQKALMADVYFTSSNAVTENGKIFNIDGAGNRVAAICFGPDVVYILVGANKFVKDEAAAVERVKSVACPQNAKSLSRKTPCAMTGNCTDCNSPDRICAYEVWLTHAPSTSSRYREIHICAVNEDMGY